MISGSGNVAQFAAENAFSLEQRFLQCQILKVSFTIQMESILKN